MDEIRSDISANRVITKWVVEQTFLGVFGILFSLVSAAAVSSVLAGA